MWPIIPASPLPENASHLGKPDRRDSRRTQVDHITVIWRVFHTIGDPISQSRSPKPPQVASRGPTGRGDSKPPPSLADRLGQHNIGVTSMPDLLAVFEFGHR